MTKEEALKVFRSYEIWDLMDNFTTDELQEMIDAIVSTPSLPSNLDEAAEEYSRRLDYYHYTGDDPSIAFKAGAEWMAGQGVKAHCIESANPLSESPDARLHLITLLYEENEHTPYVRGGDNIDIIIRKK